MKDIEKLLNDAIDAMKDRFKTIQTGRANPNIFDTVEVFYYETITPLKSLAQISTPNAREMIIKPFDKSALKEIEKAIFEANMGFTPNNDGEVIRIVIPPLTEERRKDLAKEIKAFGEEGKISIRNIRKEALNDLRDSEESEDFIKQQEKEIQELIDKYNKLVDSLVDEKNQDILNI